MRSVVAAFAILAVASSPALAVDLKKVDQTNDPKELKKIIRAQQEEIQDLKGDLNNVAPAAGPVAEPKTTSDNPLMENKLNYLKR
ncbi:hypothetical protein GC177_08015 [bacterium]|nr:hypothetical protein [bacterium]